MKTSFYLMATAIVGIACFALGANQSKQLAPKTLENLNTAMRGEAFAHAKYLLYADHAQKSGNSELATLFRRTARVERGEHFAEEAQVAGLAKDDETNLRDAISGESYEVSTMYRDFAEKARAAGDLKAALLFEEIRKDEMNHRDAFEAALSRLQPTLGKKR